MLDDTSEISINGTGFIVRSISPIVTTFRIEEYLLGFCGTNKTLKLFSKWFVMLTTLDLPINDLRGHALIV